ncbi:hypothetical protein PRK78_006257 [Emydomyces testavorans]|uniref:Uncharacterized protein n=1 Tax=Emydomyces testavorans TaxID=2070801 RepID=A0AAF0DM35_9EURO|nr:hypothetical protein PRK78_006257 [Emydomyces testavorans]
MKLSMAIASLATLSGALADRVDIWERVNYRGQHMSYVSTFLTSSMLPMTVHVTTSVYCSPNSRPDFAPGADRIIIRCGSGPMINCATE